MRIYIAVVLTFLGGSLLLFSSGHAAEAANSVYASRCQGCHGADGKGNQTMAKALQANIPDLTSKDFVKKPEKEILEVLSKGKGKMPPATGLSDKELKDLVAYMKSLSKGK